MFWWETKGDKELSVKMITCLNPCTEETFAFDRMSDEDVEYEQFEEEI